MALTYDGLMAIETSLFSEFGFHGAEPYLASAAENFVNLVGEEVRSDTVWTGEGHPQAVTVMALNTAALRTAKVQMRAAMTALDALSVAIDRAQREVREVIEPLQAMAEGSGTFIHVSPEGEISLLHYGGIPSPVPTTEERMLRLELGLANLRLWAIMNYARSADLTAAALIRRVTAARPEFTANSGPAVLAYNKALASSARRNQNLAELTLDVWSRVGPLDWRPVEEGRLDWSDAIASALGISTVKDALGTFTDHARDQALDDKVKKYGHLLGEGKKGIPVVGNILTVLEALKDGYHGPHLTNTDGPTALEEPDMEVGDSYLQGIVDSYRLDDVPGSAMTLAQAARLQRMGALDADGHDYVEDARNLRTRLDTWLHGGGPPNFPRADSLDDGDLPTARRILRQLDAALDPS